MASLLLQTVTFSSLALTSQGVTPDNFLDVPAGIRLGNLLLSAHGKGQIDADGSAKDWTWHLFEGDRGSVLDCGHSEYGSSLLR